MKLAFHSPMPPAPTGVADYSEALLPYLREAGEIEVNPAGPSELSLYNIGNNALHRDIYQRAIAQPGIALIHDAVLQHFFLGMAEAAQDPAQYIDEFVFNYGEWSRGLGDQLWRTRARSSADARYFDYPMLKRIATTSRAVIVHNPEAADQVRRHAPEATLFEIPHLFAPPPIPSPSEAEALRTTLEIPRDAMLVATFGHQRETKRLQVLLRSFHRALATGAELYLLVSGEFVSRTFEQAIGPLLDHPRIRRTGYLPESEFWRYAAMIDVCVNLRYPTAAETSGIAIRMMGIGKPVIFTASPAISRYPADACLRVGVNAAEEATLADYLVWLAKSPPARDLIGRKALAHIREHHDPRRIARAMWDVAHQITLR